MDKEDVAYICNGKLFSNQKEWNLAICNNMDGTRVYMLCKIVQSEKDISYDFTHMWNLRDKTEVHRERETKIR